MTDTRKLGPSEVPTARQVQALPYEVRRTPRAPRGPATIVFDSATMLRYSAAELRDILTGKDVSK